MTDQILSFVSRFSSLCLPFLLLVSSGPAFSQSQPAPAAPVRPPFQVDGDVKGGAASGLMNFYDQARAAETAPPDKPHRTSEQISDWVESRIATALNVKAGEIDSHMAAIAGFFDSHGLQEYRQSMVKAGFIDRVSKNGLQLNAISAATPTLLNQGAIGGNYHWLYQMPLMLTFYDKNSRNSQESAAKAQNQSIVVRVQLGRVAKGIDDMNIVIERWTIVSGT